MKFFFVSDVMQILGVSKSKAYKIIRQFNKELERKGFCTVAGRVHRDYFNGRFYCAAEPGTRTEENTECNTTAHTVKKQIKGRMG